MIVYCLYSIIFKIVFLFCSAEPAVETPKAKHGRAIPGMGYNWQTGVSEY